MIIREILKDKAKVLSMFDCFNDTKDTVEFLRRKGEDDIAEELIAMDKEYLRVRNLVTRCSDDLCFQCRSKSSVEHLSSPMQFCSNMCLHDYMSTYVVAGTNEGPKDSSEVLGETEVLPMHDDKQSIQLGCTINPVLTTEQATAIKNVIDRIEYHYRQISDKVIVENSYDGDIMLILYKAFGTLPVERRKK